MVTRKHFRETLKGGESGQALVEAALVMPLLVAIMFGAVELGRVIYASNEVSNSAKTAVQYGARSTGSASDTSGMLLAAQAETTDFVTTSQVSFATGYPTLSYVCSDGSASTGLSTDCATSHLEEVLTVETRATVDPLVHIPLLPHSYTVYGHATQTVLNQ
jgi:Flp pilus assembly protein TadG